MKIPMTLMTCNSKYVFKKIRNLKTSKKIFSHKQPADLEKAGSRTDILTLLCQTPLERDNAKWW